MRQPWRVPTILRNASKAEEQGRGIPSVSELSGRTAALASAPFAQAQEAPGDQRIS